MHGRLNVVAINSISHLIFIIVYDAQVSCIRHKHVQNQESMLVLTSNGMNIQLVTGECDGFDISMELEIVVEYQYF